MSENPNEFANDSEGARVLQLMEAGLWRKARDAAKGLCKKDRGRYLVLLIRANVGLVREMLGKGLVKDAETVIAYLATFAPADTMAMLRAEMAAPTGKRQVAALKDSGGVGWWEAALRADEALTKEVVVSPADQGAVDLLVTDGFLPDDEGADVQVARLAAELKAVRAAFAATGDGRWEDAKHALRDLSRQSIFWQWRIFLRGVRCVFEDDRETARQCFAQLPPTSALAQAAASLAPDLVAGVRTAPATATIPFYLAITGQPAAWAAPILSASASWKAGRRIQAFDDLVAGMKESFPSVVPGLPALLTDAILPSHARMNDVDWSDSEKLYLRFGNERVKIHSQLPKSVLVFFRSMCVAENGEMPHVELDRCWRMLIDLWQRCHGPDRQRDSLAWQWLGDALGKPGKLSNPFDFNGSEVRKSAAKAVKAYEKAIESDEANEGAWLGLVSLLIKQGDTKRSNKMLDDLVKKFPRNKGILILAGDRAIDRKSYPKGITMLQAALALDPLDKAIKERIVIALVLRVREASRKGAPTADLWAIIEPLLENAPGGHYMLSRWMARVRRSLLELESETGAQAEADSVAMAPSGLIRLFFAITLAFVYGVPPRKEWERAWTVASSSSECTWKSLLEMLRIMNFISDISGWGWKHTKAAIDRLLKALEYLVAPGRLQADPAGLLEALDELNVLKKRVSEPTSQAVALVIREISEAFFLQVSPSSKKTDPRLRLVCLLCDPGALRNHPKHLKSIIIDAEAAGLHSVAARARELQKAIESGSFDQPFGNVFDEDDGGDDDIWDEEDDDIWDEDDDEEPGAGGAFAPERCMDDLRTAIINGDDVAVEIYRQKLLGMGVERKKLDRIIQALTAVLGRSRSAKTGKAKKCAEKSAPDPRQIDLF